jgi:glycine cleavage system H protein
MTKYLPSHEYARLDGNFAYIGISQFAAHQLGTIVYVDMPEVDDTFEKGEIFGAIESVKAASDLYMPLSGTVVEINETLEDDPRAVGQDPMENWIIKIEVSNPEEFDELLDEKAYSELCEAEKH